MNDHVHPTFRAILNGIAAQPAMLVRAANKAAPRRFSADPQPLTGFGDLAEDDHARRARIRDEFACGFDGADDEEVTA